MSSHGHGSRPHCVPRDSESRAWRAAKESACAANRWAGTGGLGRQSDLLCLCVCCMVLCVLACMFMCDGSLCMCVTCVVPSVVMHMCPVVMCVVYVVWLHTCAHTFRGVCWLMCIMCDTCVYMCVHACAQSVCLPGV